MMDEEKISLEQAKELGIETVEFKKEVKKRDSVCQLQQIMTLLHGKEEGMATKDIKTALPNINNLNVVCSTGVKKGFLIKVAKGYKVK